MAVQLGHERLAEAHHLAFTLALGVEVRTALAAAHGQRGQRILEHLLEGEELEHAQVYRGVEAQTALVRADGAAHLDAVAAVDLHLATVIDPGHAKQNGAFRLDHALENAGLAITRIGFEEGPQTAHHLLHRLVEFRLIGIALFQARQERIDGQRHAAPRHHADKVAGTLSGTKAPKQIKMSP